MNWLWDIIVDSIVDAILGFMETFGKYISNIFSEVYKINDALPFDSIVNYSRILAMAIVQILAINQLLNVYVFRTDGDSEEDPFEIIMRTTCAVAMIYCGTFIIKRLIQYASAISTKATELTTGLNTNISDKFTNVANGLMGTETMGAALTIIMLAVIAIGFIILVFQAAKRGAELMLFTIVLPIVSV
ncbi:MAG: DUF6102 family protein, partial [Clostridia bacterium]|nr:DUF6102 family protein [Clostridia bacterium]